MLELNMGDMKESFTAFITGRQNLIKRAQK